MSAESRWQIEVRQRLHGGGRTVIVGAGPGRLTAAFELARLGRDAIVLRGRRLVGGISRSVVFRVAG